MEWKFQLFCFLCCTNNQEYQNSSKQRDKNFWYWLPKEDDKSNFKSAWHQIRNKSIEFSWCKLIWDKAYAPKLPHCALLARLNKLNTKDKISKWNNSYKQLLSSNDKQILATT